MAQGSFPTGLPSNAYGGRKSGASSGSSSSLPATLGKAKITVRQSGHRKSSTRINLKSR